MDGEAPTGEDGSLVLLEYVDLHGEPRGIYLPDADWDRATGRGVGFGSVILDYAESHNGRSIAGSPSLGPETGEITVVADPETRAPIPWVEADHDRAACRIRRDGAPSPLCARTTLADVVEAVREAGYAPRVGTDYEFVLHRSLDDADGPVDRERLDGATSTRGRPYHSRPLTERAAYLDAVFAALERMGVGIEGIHKESGRGIHEAIVAHSDPLEGADAIVVLRNVLRGVGTDHDLAPSFMPRPFEDAEGNGQHFHCSLREDETNAFADGSADDGLSTLAERFVAGVLDHADGLTALCAPTVNSYRRLRPGLWAPVDASYGEDNKTCLVRIPPDGGDRTRVEVRLPDSFANPYLALSGILAAGLDGIERDLDPGPPTTEDVYELEDAPDRRVPTSLEEALDALQADSALVAALGDPLVDQFVRLKRDEVERFRSTVTDWEVREYADRL